MIYPVPGEDGQEKNRKYEGYIKKANDLWDEFTTGRKAFKFQENTPTKNDFKKPEIF